MSYQLGKVNYKVFLVRNERQLHIYSFDGGERFEPDYLLFLLAESKLMSFTAGFKLAWGMAKELEADGLYSFEREEEERICHPAEQED